MRFSKNWDLANDLAIIWSGFQPFKGQIGTTSLRLVWNDGNWIGVMTSQHSFRVKYDAVVLPDW